MQRLLIAAMVVLVGFTAAACDRTTGAETPRRSERVVACDLVDPADARAALGGSVDAPLPTENEGADNIAGRSGCAWSTVDGRSAALVELVRTADMSGAVRRTGFSAAARFSAARSRHPEAAQENVGDRSFWVEEIATLYVLFGDSYLVVEVATPEPEDARPVAARLAVAAVNRLRDVGGQTDAAHD